MTKPQQKIRRPSGFEEKAVISRDKVLESAHEHAKEYLAQQSRDFGRYNNPPTEAQEDVWNKTISMQTSQEIFRRSFNRENCHSVKNTFASLDEFYYQNSLQRGLGEGQMWDSYETVNPPTMLKKQMRKNRKPKKAVVIVKVKHGKTVEKTIYTRVPQNVYCGSHNELIHAQLQAKLAENERAEYLYGKTQKRREERKLKEMKEWINQPDDSIFDGYTTQGHQMMNFLNHYSDFEDRYQRGSLVLNYDIQRYGTECLEWDEDFFPIQWVRSADSHAVKSCEAYLAAHLGSDLVHNIAEFTYSKHQVGHDIGVEGLSYLNNLQFDGDLELKTIDSAGYELQGMFDNWKIKLREQVMGVVGDPDRVAKTLFHIETLVDTVILMYNSSTWKLALLQLKTYLCHLTGLSASSVLFKEVWEMTSGGDSVFSRDFFSADSVFATLPTEHWLYGDYTTQGFTDYMETFKKCFSSFVEVCNSDFVKRLRRMIAYCVALGMCTVTAIPFTFLKFEEYYTSSGLEKQTWPELWTGIIDTVLWMYDKGLALFKGEPIMSVLGTQASATEYETLYAKVVGNISLYETAHLEQIDMQAAGYELALVNLIESTTLLHKRANGPEKRILAQKLLELERVKVRVLTTVNNSNMRKAPFAFFLSGTSGVGKTTSLDAMIHYVLTVNGMDTNPNLWTSLNADDAYQSEMQHYHKVFKIDDIGNIKAEWEERPSIKAIIDYINNQPITALKADVDSKGKVRLEPDIVTATTNTQDFQAHMKSNEPLAIVRRFNARITMVVREEYCLPGSNMVDPEKVKRRPGHTEYEIPDAWFFTIEQPVPTGFKGSNKESQFTWKIVTHKGVELKDVRIAQTLRYLRDVSRKHFAQQKEYLEHNAWLHTVKLCPHEMYESLCEECHPPLEVQGETSEAIFKKLQDFREWAYTVTDSVPEPIKQSSWFAMPYEKVTSLGLCERGVNSLTWASFLGAGVFAGLATLFACTTPYIVLVGVIAWVTTYVYLTVMYIHDKLKQVKKYSMMVVQPFITHKYLIGAGVLVAAIALIRNMRPRASVIGKIVTQACQDEDYVPPADTTPRLNAYVTPYVEPVKHKHTLKTMTHEQMVGVVKRALAHARFTYGGGNIATCNAFPYRGNTWIVPCHMMARGVTQVEIIRAPGGLNNNRVCKITEGCWRRVEGTDLALVTLVTVGEVLNTSEYYMPNSSPPQHQAVSWVFKEKSLETKEEAFNASLGVISVPDPVTQDVYTYTAWQYKLPYATQAGFCIAPLIAKGRTPYVVGFHTAGRTGDVQGIASFVSAEQLNNTYAQLFSRVIGDFENINVQVASQGDMQLEYADQGIKLLGTIHEKSPLNFQTEGGHIEIYGAHSGDRRTIKSRCVNTVMSDAVTEEFGVPPMHGKPQGMNTFWPWHNDLETVLKVDQLDPTFLGLAYADTEVRFTSFFKNLSDEKKSSIRPLGHTATLSGVDGVFGIDAMKLSTSMGWPYCKPKSKFIVPSDKQVEGITRPLEIDEKIMENINRLSAEMKTGHRAYLPFRMNLKDEPCKLNKKKVRTFGGGCIEMLYLLRKYFLPIVKVMMDNPAFFSCAVGINATSKEWTILAEHLKKHGVERCMNGDYAKFDSRMINQMVLLAFTLLITCAWICGYSDEDLMLMTTLATEVAHALVEYNGEYVLFHSQNLSGHALTVFINNIVNILYMAYAYYELADFALNRAKQQMYEDELLDYLKKEGWSHDEIEGLLDRLLPPLAPLEIGSFGDHVSLMCYGDDNNMSVSPECTWFNHTLVAYSLSRVGVKYTMADKEAKSVPFIHFDNTTFLKRGFVWSEKLQNYLAPLDMDSLYKTLHVCIKSTVIDEMEQGRDAVLAVNRELFFHGKEVFQEMHDKLARVVEKTGLSIYLPNGELPSYQEYETKYIFDNGVQLTAR